MFNSAKRIFIVGIKGVAMANLAVIIKKMGREITGADLSEEFITDKLLKDNKIKYFIGFNIRNLPQDTDLIIYSAAHHGINNPIVQEGLRRKIKVASQAEIIGEITAEFKNVIAVCGCHGKTTTSSLLVYALKKLGAKPSYLIGAPSFNNFSGGDIDGKDYFVIEADEYGVDPPLDKTPKFSFLKPNYIICTNIDFDHPDVYENIEETKKVFFDFLSKGRKLFLCQDDKNLMDVAQKISKDKYLTFTDNSFSGDLLIPGKKNRSNAGGVSLCLLNLGFKVEEINEALSSFRGAKRRFEKIFNNDLFSVYDDYGHHPNEIKATIQAVRERFPGKRLILIFQPHTYSRTLSLLKLFSVSLSMADTSYILPIFASARENSSDFKVSSFDIENQARANNKRNVIAVVDSQELLSKLKSNFQKDDIIMTIGAGNVYKLSEEIIIFLQLVSMLGGERVEFNKELTNMLTLHTKTIAEYFYEARSKKDWQTAVKTAYDLKIPVFVLGGGSNVAITKDKINGLVIKNNYIKKEIISQTKNEAEVLVSSGYPTGLFVSQMIEAGYEGVEYHKGLPGTVGGAIYMNSKWTKPLRYFGDSIVRALLLQRDGEFKTVDRKYFKFGYDYSALHDSQEILVDITFKFKKTDPSVLNERAKEAVLYRLKSQPKGVSSCGCFFRNISEEERVRAKLPTTSVGYIIDKLGMKGTKIGGFEISTKHANFIINNGGKKSAASDLRRLLSLIKNKTKEKFNIDLKEEVVLI